MANVTFGELKERLDRLSGTRQKLLGQIDGVKLQIKKQQEKLALLGIASEEDARKLIAKQEKEMLECMQKLDNLLAQLEQ